LRVALDREGGEKIALDFPLILTSRQLREPQLRDRLLAGLADLPGGHIWLRVGGFGVDATGIGMSRFIEAVQPLQRLGRPIIADQVAGLAGLAGCAFGATSGYAHGVEGKRRSDFSDWLKPRESGRGGRTKRIFLPSLDRALEVSMVQQLFDDARTARQLFGCADATCCGSIERMLSNPEGHLMVQQSRTAAWLSAVPESARVDEFVKHVEDRSKEARRATRLRKMSDGMRKTVCAAAQRLERVDDALKGLHMREGRQDFAPEAPLRAGKQSTSRANPSRRPS
jgi:hypothetical protein